MSRIEQHHCRQPQSASSWKSWRAKILTALFMIIWGVAAAHAETRTLKIYYVHTGEKAAITFKRNGVYDQAGLKKLNMILRDWRRNEPTRMDPRLFDLIWSVYNSVGARDYIHVVCGYRSPATNSMLRSRSSGVAKHSQHTLGKAMDFYIPGVSLKTLRAAGMKAQVGGVGYYPRSGSPFVHMDVGNVRHWPRMSRSELVALFPNGKTLHVPSDGKPLPGFEQAVAAYEARKRSGGDITLASATKPSRGLLERFLRGGDEEDEEGVNDEPAPRLSAAKTVVAANTKPVAKPGSGIQIVSPQDAMRVDLPTSREADAPKTDSPETILASLPTRSVPVPAMAPRQQSEVVVASAQTEAAAPVNIPFGPASQELPANALVEERAPATTPFEAAKPTPTAQQANASQQPKLPFGMAQQPLPDESAATASAPTGVPLPTPRPGVGAATLQSAQSASALQQMAALEPDQIGGAQQAAPRPSGRPVATEMRGANGQPVDTGTQGRIPGVRPEFAMLDPEATATARVRTAAKGARATPADVQQDRKVRVKAAEPTAAQWVMNGETTTNTVVSTRTSSYAYSAVVAPPREVYTTGFVKKNDKVSEIGRFTGKAVQFLSVAHVE